MTLINKIRKEYLFIITTVLLLVTLVNYSDFEIFNIIRMNDFFSGFFAGFLITMLFTVMINYTKLKK